jgi:hypothetical protein
MAQATYYPKPCPSMCATQLQTALGDLQDDFKLVQGLADFLQEELCRLNHTSWPVMRPYLLALALDHRAERFRLNLSAVAELAQDAR